jgi:hypothetical protein
MSGRVYNAVQNVAQENHSSASPATGFAHRSMGSPPGGWSAPNGVTRQLHSYAEAELNRPIPILALLACTACGGNAGTEPAPDASLAGIVREAATAAPLAGATVAIGSINATTGQDGRFSIHGVPVGNSVFVEVTAPRFDSYIKAISLQPGQNTHDVELDRKVFYESGDVLVYLPLEVTAYRGVLFTILGGSRDARPLLRGDMGPYQDLTYPYTTAGYLVRYREAMTEFARTHSFAVLATWFVSQHQWNAGTYASILNSLRSIATESGHPELAEAPLLLHGHSAGACVSYDFSIEHAQRVIGFVFSKAACLERDASPALSVPAYFFAGLDDPISPEAAGVIQATFDRYRARGAVWATAIDDGAGHGMVGDIDLLFKWMAEVNRLRLPEASAGSAPIQLRSLSEATGWLGDPQTFAIAEYRCFPGDRSRASWLPSLGAARDWQSLASRRSLTDLREC